MLLTDYRVQAFRYIRNLTQKRPMTQPEHVCPEPSVSIFCSTPRRFMGAGTFVHIP